MRYREAHRPGVARQHPRLLPLRVWCCGTARGDVLLLLLLLLLCLGLRRGCGRSWGGHRGGDVGGP